MKRERESGIKEVYEYISHVLTATITVNQIQLNAISKYLSIYYHDKSTLMSNILKILPFS